MPLRPTTPPPAEATVPGPRSTARDLWVVRLRRLNRGVVGGTVLLIGVFSEVAAHALPGRSVTRTASTVAPAATKAPARPARHRHRHRHPPTSVAPAATSPSAAAAAPTPTPAPSPAPNPTPTPSPAPTPTPTPADTAPATPPQSLAPPAQAPAPTEAPAQTTSGGS
jgi:hypothetical protein